MGQDPDRLAVNAHHGAEQVATHLDDRVHVSVEPGQARGTAGALGFAKSWIDDRDVLVTNADGWFAGELSALVEQWTSGAAGEEDGAKGPEVITETRLWQRLGLVEEEGPVRRRVTGPHSEFIIKPG